METESSAQRRLDSITRHLLLLPLQSDHGVRKMELSSNGRLKKHEETGPVVIGGMVLDIHATPSIHANPRTTTPGKVSYVLGGVGRNVAECISKLGAKPFMISALGPDMAGNLLLEHWRSAGLSTEGICNHQTIETAVVCSVLDTNGELAAAVASVESIVSSVAAESKIPVWFEPVSVEKSRRISTVAKYISFASPNEDELVAMANALSHGNMYRPIKRESSTDMCCEENLFHMLKPAVWVLLDMGIKIVIVTIGSDGVFLCSKGGSNTMKNGCEGIRPYVSSDILFNAVTATCPPKSFSSFHDSERSSFLFALHFPALPASVVRLTGAGDCLVGGTISSLCAGLDIMQSVAVGIAASKAAVEAETNVPGSLNLAAIADDAGSVYSAAKVVFYQSML